MSTLLHEYLWWFFNSFCVIIIFYKIHIFGGLIGLPNIMNSNLFIYIEV